MTRAIFSRLTKILPRCSLPFVKSTYTAALFLFLALLFLPTESVAQEALAAFASPVVGKAKPAFRYQLFAFPSEPVRGQAATFSSLEQSLFLSVPVWQSDSDEITFQGSVRGNVIQTEAMMPTTGSPFPKNLTDVRFGPTYRHSFGNGWVTGINIQAGSASDKPFAKYDDSEFMASWFLRMPSGGSNAWLFFLNYSNNRDFANHIPIPGFGYSFGDNKWCRGLLGVPIVALTLLPKSKLNLSLTYLPLLNITSELGYDFIPPLRFFTEFKWSSEIYFRNDQPDKKRRLFLVDKRISAGLRIRPSRWAEIRLSGGWIFDRMSFESRSVYKDRDYNRLDFGAGPFGLFELKVRMLGKS